MPVTIASNPSGSGTFTITNPASASNRTLTLPDAAGTVMLTDTLATRAQLATALNASGSAPIYACRAWVNFNGTGTVAIRASGNVSSITDIGTGRYKVNFATAMVDANFATQVTASSQAQYLNDGSGAGCVNTYSAPTTLSVDVMTFLAINQAGNDAAAVYTNVSVFR